MPKAEPVRINPGVLVWAREGSALTVEGAAEMAHVDARDLLAWENGGALPGISHLRELARVYRRPLTVLLLPHPPPNDEFPTDFRTVGGRSPALSREVLHALRRARRFQRIASELAGEDDTLFSRFAAGIANLQEAPEEAGQRERATLHVTVSEQLRWPNRTAFSRWRAAVQRAGLLAIVEAMPREDCRGFALWDPTLLPVLVVTSDESDSAKCFTLLHEYAHVLLRSGAACLESEDNSERGQIERWCNRFAGAVLAPREALEHALGAFSRDRAHLLDARAVTNAAARLQVSRDVIAIRLEQLELVPAGFYNSLKHEFVRDSLKAVRMRQGEIRIPLHRRRLTELGFSLPLAVMRAHERGFLDLRETAELLDVGADGLPALATAANEARSQSA